MLIIDDRENEKVKQKLLMRMGDFSKSPDGRAKIKRLKSADYVIGQWGVEAKEINDLYRSILGIGRTRTILDQLRDLEENFDKPFLVVYNTKLKPYVHGRPTAQKMAIEMTKMQKVINQFKLTFYQRFPNIMYMELPSMDSFCDWLVVNHTQMTLDGGAQINRLPDFVRKAYSEPVLDDRVAILTTLSGITPPMAVDLLQKFGSIPQILHSRRTQKALMEVDGIGRKKAQKILSLRDSFKSKE